MPHVFQRYAGSLQLRLASFDDCIQLLSLPAEHWVATACPIDGLACDRRFLDFVDYDHNGRIRIHEARTAVTFVHQHLKNYDQFNSRQSTIRLDDLSEKAGPLREAAEQVLYNLNIDKRSEITLEQIRQTGAILARGDANGDGVITPVSLSDGDLRSVVTDILAYIPGVNDTSGAIGLNQDTIELFRTARREALAWHDAKSKGFAWGENSVDRALLVRKLQPRLTEFFLQCRFVATQPDAADQLRVPPQHISELLGNVAALSETVASLPVAPANPEGQLYWNRCYRGSAVDDLQRLQTGLAKDCFGSDVSESMNESQWKRLLKEAEPILTWYDQSQTHPVLKLGVERLRHIDDGWLDRLKELSQHDLQLGRVLGRVSDLEKLALYQQYLLQFLNNFASMPDLYIPDNRALFAQGTLFMAGRSFPLAVLVPNRAAHLAYTADSTICTMYIEVSGGDPKQAFEVAVPVTRGTTHGLVLNRRGIFRTPEGGEFDARLIMIHKEPVSMWEAIISPFTRIGGYLSSRVEKFSSSIDNNFDKHVTDQTKLIEGKAPEPSPAKSSNMGGMLMSGSIAFAAVGSGLAFIAKQISDMGIVNLVTGLFVVCLLLAAPTALLAWIKLRRRDLAMVLEASGWALNDRLRLTRSLARLFTHRRPRPPGSRVEVLDQVSTLNKTNIDEDPEPRRWWPLIVIVLIILITSGCAYWIYGPTAYAEQRRITAHIQRVSPELTTFTELSCTYSGLNGGTLTVIGTVDSPEQLQSVNSKLLATRSSWWPTHIDVSAVTIRNPAQPSHLSGTHKANLTNAPNDP